MVHYQYVTSCTIRTLLFAACCVWWEGFSSAHTCTLIVYSIFPMSHRWNCHSIPSYRVPTSTKTPPDLTPRPKKLNTRIKRSDWKGDHTQRTGRLHTLTHFLATQPPKPAPRLHVSVDRVDPSTVGVGRAMSAIHTHTHIQTHNSVGLFVARFNSVP